MKNWTFSEIEDTINKNDAEMGFDKALLSQYSDTVKMLYEYTASNLSAGNMQRVKYGLDSLMAVKSSIEHDIEVVSMELNSIGYCCSSSTMEQCTRTARYNETKAELDEYRKTRQVICSIIGLVGLSMVEDSMEKSNQK